MSTPDRPGYVPPQEQHIQATEEVDTSYADFAEGKFNNSSVQDSGEVAASDERQAQVAERERQDAEEIAEIREKLGLPDQPNENQQEPIGERATPGPSDSLESQIITPQEIKDRADKAQEAIKKYHELLNQLQAEIQAVTAMPAGSREKYDAAFAIRDAADYGKYKQALDNDYHHLNLKTDLRYADVGSMVPRSEVKNDSGKVTGYTSESIYPVEVQSAMKDLAELKTRSLEVQKEMMNVWREARDEYEQSRKAAA